MQLTTLQTSRILVPKDRAREIYEGVKSLAVSIKEHGLQEPLVVEKLEGDEKFDARLLAGGRRIAACLVAGLKEVPVHMHTEPLSPIKRRTIELIENQDRKEMKWWEEVLLRAEIHELLVEEHGMQQSLRDTATYIGVSPATMSLDLEMAKAIDLMPELKKCTTKAEAGSYIHKMKGAAQKEEAVQQFEETHKGTDYSNLKKEIISQFVVGDFFSITNMPGIKKNSFVLAEVDPPYAIDLSSKKGKATSCVGYNEVALEEYDEFVRKTAQLCWDYLAVGGWLVWWHSASPSLSNLVMEILKDVGFKGCEISAVWLKQGSAGVAGQPRYMLGSTYESFFYLSKDSGQLAKSGRSNSFIFPPVPPATKCHPTQRPVGMIKEVLETFGASRGPVLVPFAGSGATILAANELHTTALGFDLTQDFKTAFAERVWRTNGVSYSVEECLTIKQTGKGKE